MYPTNMANVPAKLSLMFASSALGRSQCFVASYRGRIFRLCIANCMLVVALSRNVGTAENILVQKLQLNKTFLNLDLAHLKDATTIKIL
jgi:hypothetical protein